MGPRTVRPPVDICRGTSPSQAPAADQPAPNQRDAHGRFARGNRGGPGNPFARQSAALRQALQSAVTAQDISAITAAHDLAVGGLVEALAASVTPVSVPDRDGAAGGA